MTKFYLVMHEESDWDYYSSSVRVLFSSIEEARAIKPTHTHTEVFGRPIKGEPRRKRIMHDGCDINL